MGQVTSMIPLIFFSLNFILEAQCQGLIDAVIWIIYSSIVVLIGSGLWVQGQQEKTLWIRLKAALKLERSEVGDLASELFRPSSGETLLRLFAQFAYIDRKLLVREREFIEHFARSWQLKIDWCEYEYLADEEQSVSFVGAYHTAVQYLRTSPPATQVAQVIDVLEALVFIDEVVSDEEQLILEEVRGLLLGYLGNTDVNAEHAVVIAPQDHDQDVAIATLLPEVSKVAVAGGSGYLVGRYFSPRYAELICNQYRALGFFTIEISQAVPAKA